MLLAAFQSNLKRSAKNETRIVSVPVSYTHLIGRYAAAQNAATASEVDANANVESKNIATLETELYKRDAICVNRLAMYAKLKALYLSLIHI